MTWEIRAKAKIALTMYYPWGMTDWAVPKPENMPEFFVSEDRVNWDARRPQPLSAAGLLQQLYDPDRPLD